MRHSPVFVSLFLLAASASAQDPPACQFDATIKNQTGKSLLVSAQALPMGTWVTKPASSIASGGQNSFSSRGPARNAVGTQGWLKYTLDGGSNTVLSIFWNVPWGTPQTIRFSGSNDISIQKNDGGCTLDGGSLYLPDWACKHCRLTITVTAH